jgi:hypothetical protein
MMDDAELTKTLRQVDAMRDRVQGIINRKRPLELDKSTGQKPLRARPTDYGHGRDVIGGAVSSQRKPTFAHDYPPPIASGDLVGHEMRARPRDDEDPAPGGYDSDPMWAQFERDFDAMVAGR